MAYIMLEDMYGQLECVLFPKAYEKFKNNIKEEEILKISGTLKYEKGSEPKVLVDSVELFEEPKEEVEIEKEVVQERDWLLIKLSSEKEKYLDEILDTLNFYVNWNKKEENARVFMTESKKLNV